MDDTVLFEALGVVGRGLEVGGDHLLELRLHRDPVRGVAHELGDVGALDAPALEVGLERAHVQQPRHGVDVAHHKLEHLSDGRGERLQRRREDDGLVVKFYRRDPQAVLARRGQRLEQLLARGQREQVAIGDGHVVCEPDEVAQLLLLGLCRLDRRDAIGVLLLDLAHRLGALRARPLALTAVGRLDGHRDRSVGVDARPRGHVLADLFDESLQFVHNLLKGLGRVLALLLLLLDEVVDHHEVGRHRGGQPRLLARAQLVAERVDLEQRRAEGRLREEEALDKLVALGDVELVAHVGAPQAEDLRGEVVLEEADRREHVEEGRLLHPCRQLDEFRWKLLLRREDVHDSASRHGEVLRVGLLARDHGQVVRPEFVPGARAVEVHELDRRVVAIAREKVGGLVSICETRLAGWLLLGGGRASVGHVDRALFRLASVRCHFHRLCCCGECLGGAADVGQIIVIELLDVEGVEWGALRASGVRHFERCAGTAAITPSRGPLPRARCSGGSETKSNVDPAAGQNGSSYQFRPTGPNK